MYNMAAEIKHNNGKATRLFGLCAEWGTRGQKERQTTLAVCPYGIVRMEVVLQVQTLTGLVPRQLISASV